MLRASKAASRIANWAVGGQASPPDPDGTVAHRRRPDALVAGDRQGGIDDHAAPRASLDRQHFK